MSSEKRSRREIIVVGGGVFGIGAIDNFIRYLDPAAIHITLIEKRDDFLYIPIDCRNLTEDVSGWFIRPYNRLFSRKPTLGQVKKGLVIGFDHEQKIVKLESGEVLSYDILVRYFWYSLVYGLIQIS